METLWRDVRYALHGFGRRPAFVIAVLFTLALGIGANTVIFSVVNAVLLNPLSLSNWKAPDRMLMLWEKNSSLTVFFANQLPVRPQNYRAWKEQAHSFERLAAWRDSNVTLTDPNHKNRKPEQVECGSATADLFPLLGIRPRLGRNFSADEMRTGKGQVAILSDEMYQSRFNRDPHILGSTVLANGQPFVVIGVLPPRAATFSIWGGTEQKTPKLWMPLNIHPEKKDDEANNLYVFGRLKDGVSVTAARAEMRVIERRLAKTHLEEGGFGINAVTLREANTEPDLRHAVLVLQIAVGFVLLIACANAGNLLLSRAVDRDKEMAIRSAIGASKFHLFRQTLTESLLLSSFAAILGLLFSLGALRALSAIAPTDQFALHELRIDRTVLAFTAGLAAAAGILFGLVPAFHAWKKDVNEVLNRSSRSVAGSSNGLRGTLVVVETALSVVLVIGAGLMIRSLSTIMHTDLGFQIDHLLVMRLVLPELTYSAPEKISSFNNRLLASVRGLSGVQTAALTNALPMKSVSQSSFEIPGRAQQKDRLPVTDWARVSDGYFETLRMRVLNGRTFTRDEATLDDPAVAVVNQAFARTYFAHENVLGKLVKFGNEKGTSSTFRVVGVVANEHQMGPDNQQSAELYLPGQHLKDFLVVARTQGDPLKLANAVKQQVWNIDPELPVAKVMTEEAALREWSAPRRFNLIVMLSFAAAAVLLAALGIYSVLAYTVTLRTREIGIRMALGAEPKAITGYVLRRGLLLSITGIAIGLAAALGLTRFMTSLIYGVSALDPATFGIVAGLLVSVALAASYIPALRASKIDPIESCGFL
jgi:putative ABC transport system permease protein